MKLVYKVERETKGTRVYAETKGGEFVDKKESTLGTLYVQKSSELAKKDTLNIEIK